MQVHKLTIICEGAGAAQGQLDAADVAQITMGAKRLLTANAFFYTEGRVPRHPGTSTAHFSLEADAPGGEPWTYDAWIRVVGSAVYDVTKHTFEDQLVSSLLAWQRGTSLSPPEFARVPEGGSGNLYSSIWDSEPPLRAQLLRLSGRVAQAVEMIAGPPDRSVFSMRVLLDASPLLRFGASALAGELAEYSRRMRAGAQVAQRII